MSYEAQRREFIGLFFFKYSGRNKYFCLLDYMKDWKELNFWKYFY